MSPHVTVEKLGPGTVDRLAAGQRDALSHNDFPQETDVALARLAVEQRAWGEPVLLLIRADGVAVGTVALTPDGTPDGGWSVGYHVIAAARRRGVATAALQIAAAGYRPLTAETERDNTASVRVLTKAGFQLSESGDPAVLQWVLSD